MHAAIRTQSTTRNLPCCVRYVLQVSHITFDTADIDEWTGRLRVWMYWIHPKTIPATHTKRPAMRPVDPVRAPPMNDTAFRSGILMSDSLARADGMQERAIAAAAPKFHRVGDFIMNWRVSDTDSWKIFARPPRLGESIVEPGLSRPSGSRSGSRRDGMRPVQVVVPPTGCMCRRNLMEA